MSYCAQGLLFTFFNGSSNEYGDNRRLLLVLKALKDDELIWMLESKRKGRRNRYPVRMLWQSLIAGKVYGIPTVNGLIRELNRNESLRNIVGIRHTGLVPKPWQFSRLFAKLSCPEKQAMVKSIFDRAVGALKELLPDLGERLGD